MYPAQADAYVLHEAIGKGASASVYRATCVATQEAVAVKIVDLEHYGGNWSDAAREVTTLPLLHHSNIVHMFNSFVQGHDLWMIMPLLEGGSCASLLRSHYPLGVKDERVLATIVREVLHALEYLHKDARIHRDIKAGNILVSATGQVQLADFGVSATLCDHGERQWSRSTFTGTLCWMAPEVMQQGADGYDSKADIWSLGITCLELAFGHAPYSRMPPMKSLLLTVENDPPDFDSYPEQSRHHAFSSAFQSFVARCLTKDPSKRVDAHKLLQHRFLKQAQPVSYLVQHLLGAETATSADASTRRLSVALSATHARGSTPSSTFSVDSWEFANTDTEAVVRSSCGG